MKITRVYWDDEISIEEVQALKGLTAESEYLYEQEWVDAVEDRMAAAGYGPSRAIDTSDSDAWSNAIDSVETAHLANKSEMVFVVLEGDAVLVYTK